MAMRRQRRNRSAAQRTEQEPNIKQKGRIIIKFFSQSCMHNEDFPCKNTSIDGPYVLLT